MRKEPELKDFYDEQDPRGCSTSEYDDYMRALKVWRGEKEDITDNLLGVL